MKTSLKRDLESLRCVFPLVYTHPKPSRGLCVHLARVQPWPQAGGMRPSDLGHHRGVPSSHLRGETLQPFLVNHIFETLSAHVSFPSRGFHPVLKTRAVQEAFPATLPTSHTATVGISNPGRQCPEKIITQKVNTTAFYYHNNEITSTFVPDESGHATVEVLLNTQRKILQFTLQGDPPFNTPTIFC